MMKKSKVMEKRIEKAIEQITREKVELMASGRTDSGVHALRSSGKF